MEDERLMAHLYEKDGELAAWVLFLVPILFGVVILLCCFLFYWFL